MRICFNAHTGRRHALGLVLESLLVTTWQIKSKYYSNNSSTHIVLFRLVHAFTCAGMLQSQFVNFCTFAELGEVKQCTSAQVSACDQ